MKVLAFFALSAVATAAMAVQPPSTITLNGPSVQMTNSVGTAISNTSGAHNEALQNIASNAGPVQVFAGGSSTQTALPARTSPATTVRWKSALLPTRR